MPYLRCSLTPAALFLIFWCALHLKSEASLDEGQKEQDLGTDDNHWSERRRLVEEWEDHDEVG